MLCTRAKNAILHDGLPLQRESELLKAENLHLASSAKLVICSLSAEKSMTADTKSGQERLIQLMRAVKTCLHPLGTVAMLVPHPWRAHLGRLAGKCIFSSLIDCTCTADVGGMDSLTLSPIPL